jgi:hypothetical protein
MVTKNKTIFDQLTSEEAARINMFFRQAGWAVVNWESRQEEFNESYKPARTMKNVDRPILYEVGSDTYEALTSYYITADRVNMIHYPDMRQEEINCMAAASFALAAAENDTLKYITFLTIRPLSMEERKIEVTAEVKAENLPVPRKTTFWERIVRYFDGY